MGSFFLMLVKQFGDHACTDGAPSLSDCKPHLLFDCNRLDKLDMHLDPVSWHDQARRFARVIPARLDVSSDICSPNIELWTVSLKEKRKTTTNNKNKDVD